LGLDFGGGSTTLEEIFRAKEQRMFESLQERLGAILNGLTGRGALSDSDVSAALREVRRGR
jgi:hypothetical protein